MYRNQSRTQNYTSRRQDNWAPSRARSYSRNQNLAMFQPSVKLGPIAHTILVALMILVLGLIYLTQTTKPVGYGYEAQKIDAEIAELESRKADLEVENARLTALEAIEGSSVAQEMVAPESINYID